MKKILITGAGSFIGESFVDYLNHDDDYYFESIDMRNEDWKKKDFSFYDVVIHLAAIVHKKNIDDSVYFKVNRDLAFETAQKAKREGVSQFIFFSTMSVYGMESGEITRETDTIPKTSYGKSKIEAENLLKMIEVDSFKICILRPPMIYGKNSVGNYSKLSNFAKKIPIFPKVNNERSMLYIDNLSIFLKLAIDEKLSGTFFPQNKEYVNTSELVQLIAEVNGKRVWLISNFDGVVRLLSKKILNFKKLFGNLTYSDKYMFISTKKNTDYSKLIEKYYQMQTNFFDSIRITEGENIP